jgi:hypothetical protein
MSCRQNDQADKIQRAAERTLGALFFLLHKIDPTFPSHFCGLSGIKLEMMS